MYLLTRHGPPSVVSLFCGFLFYFCMKFYISRGEADVHRVRCVSGHPSTLISAVWKADAAIEDCRTTDNNRLANTAAHKQLWAVQKEPHAVEKTGVIRTLQATLN